MKHLLLLLMLGIVVLGCETLNPDTEAAMEEAAELEAIDLTNDPLSLFEVPRPIDQESYFPEENEKTYYFDQSVLYSEYGARFYNWARTSETIDKAIEYFELSKKYDRYNNKALFGMGLIYYERGRIKDALKEFLLITPQEQRFPYDIDYYSVSRMILGFFPFEARITALPQGTNLQAGSEVVVINKGRNQGTKEGMEFTIYRVGNKLRDVETMEEIGMQRTPIGKAIVIDVNDNNSLCRLEDIDERSYIQIGDVLETSYLKKLEKEFRWR